MVEAHVVCAMSNLMCDVGVSLLLLLYSELFYF